MERRFQAAKADLAECEGEQAGKLWEDRRGEYGRLNPVYLTDGPPATFSRWYEEWLDNCFATAGQTNWR